MKIFTIIAIGIIVLGILLYYGALQVSDVEEQIKSVINK